MHTDQPAKNVSRMRYGELSFLRYRADGWDGWVLESWSGFAGFADLDAWLSDRGCQEPVLEVPCRTITRAVTPLGTVYAKLMRAQNDGVLRKNELFSKFKWMFYPSRGRGIVLRTAAMLSLGHNCPVPVLGLRRRHGLRLPEDLLVATELTDPTVEARLREAAGDSAARAAILETCGRELASLHADRFIHGDFLPRNVCLSRDGTTFSFLDNDRTHRWPCTPPFHFLRRNLTQFCFNLWLTAESPDPGEADTFISAYAAAAGWDGRRTQAERRRIHQANTRRWNKTAGRELKRKRQLAAAAASGAAGAPRA